MKTLSKVSRCLEEDTHNLFFQFHTNKFLDCYERKKNPNSTMPSDLNRTCTSRKIDKNLDGAFLQCWLDGLQSSPVKRPALTLKLCIKEDEERLERGLRG